MTGARVLIVGWDGATWDLAKPWIDAGRLPTLKTLLEEGTHADLNSTTPPMTLPSWSSMLTGCNPGKHGIFDFMQHNRPGVAEFSNASHRLTPTIHRILSDRGGRVASIAVPTTWPPDQVNGVVVSGFDSPVSTGIDGSFCHPKSLYSQLTEKFGGLRFADFQESHIDDGWHDRARELLLQEIERKEKIGSWLLEQERWDCFMLLFGESDTASHHFWMYHDEESPRFQTSGKPELRETIADVYQRLDRALGMLIEKAKPDVVCICSDHGFGGAGVHAIYLNRFLEQHGWLKYHRQIQVNGLRAGSGVMDRARAAAVRYVPPSLQGRIFRAIPNRILSAIERRARYGNINMARSRLYSDELNYAATVRTPNPISESEYSALKAALMDWTVDGHPVIQAVERREELYWGDAVSRSPEIILTPHLREGYSYTILPSQRAQKGQLWRCLEPHEFKGGKGLGMNGTHRQYGVLSLWGQNIAAKQSVAANMMDIAPTLLHAMGEAVPEHMDGDVLMDAFNVDTPVRYATSSALHATVQDANAAEAEAIRRRLEGLGYL